MNVKRFFGKVIQQYLIIVDGERNYKEHRHLQEPNDPQCANRILTPSFPSGMTMAERMTCSLLLSNHALGMVRESETAHRSTHHSICRGLAFDLTSDGPEPNTAMRPRLG